MTAPVPMAGVNPVDFLSKQEYTIDTIKKDMFSDPKEDKMKVMVPNVVVPGVTVSRLWDAVFADGSTFLQLYHDKRNERDLKVGSWIMAPDKGSGYRFVSLTTIVEVPSAGTPTPLNEAHRFCYVRTGSGLKLVYHISSQTPDVPFGSSFRTEALCFITADSDTADCSIAFWGKCRGMSFQYRPIQYIAEPRAIREMTAAYKVMVEMILEEVSGTKVEIAVPAAEAPAAAESGGGGGAPADPGFQAAILGLGVFVALLTFMSLRRIMAAARTASQLATQPASAWVGNTLAWSAHTDAVGGNGGVDRRRGANGSGPGVSPPSSAFSYMQSAHMAANDAEMQSLRYRYVEQRSALSSLEGSVRWLWWVVVLEGALLVGMALIIRNTEGKDDADHHRSLHHSAPFAEFFFCSSFPYQSREVFGKPKRDERNSHLRTTQKANNAEKQPLKNHHHQQHQEKKKKG
eukprot:gene1530-915_t